MSCLDSAALIASSSAVDEDDGWLMALLKDVLLDFAQLNELLERLADGARVFLGSAKDVAGAAGEHGERL